MTMAPAFRGGGDRRRERIGSAAVVAALHALLAYAFLTGLGYAPLPDMPDELKIFTPAEEPPPPPEAIPPKPRPKEARKPRPKSPEGAASPANLKNSPTEVVAPPPPIPFPVPPPLPAAPIAGTGSAPAAGASTVPGPGTGAGGVGQGLGSGLSGDGTGGGGGGGGLAVHARQVAGRIDDDDYPPRAYQRRAMGVVHIRFVVAPNGRVSRCAVTRSSGHRDLDEITCRLILNRFRYRPARDASGRPVAETISGEQEWEMSPEPPVREVEPELSPDDD
jgi:protein TonB